jgi:hypothetical protein
MRFGFKKTIRYIVFHFLRRKYLKDERDFSNRLKIIREEGRVLQQQIQVCNSGQKISISKNENDRIQENLASVKGIYERSSDKNSLDNKENFIMFATTALLAGMFALSGIVFESNQNVVFGLYLATIAFLVLGLLSVLVAINDTRTFDFLTETLDMYSNKSAIPLWLHQKLLINCYAGMEINCKKENLGETAYIEIAIICIAIALYCLLWVIGSLIFPCVSIWAFCGVSAFIGLVYLIFKTSFLIIELRDKRRKTK